MIVRPDDPLFNYVPESIRTDEVEVVEDPVPAVVEPPSSDEARSSELDLDSSLLVMGIMQLQLLQLPIQPRRFSEWTVAPRKFTVRCYCKMNWAQYHVTDLNSRRWRHDKNVRVSSQFFDVGGTKGSG